jgi:hypothetical protein
MTRVESRHHLPLVSGDTPHETVGCRHTNPRICAKHWMPSVCAFARADGMCKSPPLSWRKRYTALANDDA